MPNINMLLAGVAAVAIAGLAGGWVGWKLRDDSAARAALKAEVHVVTVVQHQAAVNEAASTARATSHAQIVYQTKTLIEKVPEYVPASVVRECVINRGFISLLNSSANNVPAPPDSAIQPNDAPSGVGLDTVASSVVGNYGHCNDNADELTKLQDWVRASGLAPPANP